LVKFGVDYVAVFFDVPTWIVCDLVGPRGVNPLSRFRNARVQHVI
jgi:hypothetical protein